MCQRKACSGSKLLDLLVQTLLFYACCFTGKTGYYKSKLTSFTEDPGCHRLSLCMSFAGRTAAKLGPCCQPCFTATDLLLLPAPHTRYKHTRCECSKAAGAIHNHEQHCVAQQTAVQGMSDHHHHATSTKINHHTYCLDGLCFLSMPHCSLSLAELTN